MIVLTNNLEKNKKYCEVIESKITLDAKPVAMKLVKTEDDRPEGIELIGEKSGIVKWLEKLH